jgi:hypothetical protein
LASTLHHFGDVTGLVTNCTKIQVAPIRCAGARPSRYLASLPGYPHDLPNEILRAPPCN